ncbi:MAG: CobW family GTP-binding protein [Pseudomonadota bacterium]
MRPPAPASRPRQPLTVIGGFLGAGKTTLVNHLLAAGERRYAVLVNDFGAINVDAGLIASHDGQTLRLTNGCICCSLGEGFLTTLARVLAEPEGFDHILIEASGVGDPSAIADIALVEPDLVLSAILVVVDAESIASQLRDPRIGGTVLRQVQAADLLILNKCDRLDAAGRAQARAALEALAPRCPVLEAVEARIPADIVTPGLAPARSRFRAASPARHEARFGRILYERSGAFDPDGLRAALNRTPASLLRLKGWVRLGPYATPHLLQMVGRRWTLTPAPETAPPGDGIALVGIACGAVPAGCALADLLDLALLHAPVPRPASSPALPRTITGDTPRCH